MLIAKNLPQGTVTVGGWGVSCATGSHIKGAILSVYVSDSVFFPGKIEYCSECNGKTFASSDDAFQHAFEHGHLMPYITKRRGNTFCGEMWEKRFLHNIAKNVRALIDSWFKVC